MSQLTFFNIPQKRRATPRVMMHVVDAGPGECAEGSHMVVLECDKCGHETGWIKVRSVTEGKRGKPCPKCNTAQPGQ